MSDSELIRSMAGGSVPYSSNKFAEAISRIHKLAGGADTIRRLASECGLKGLRKKPAIDSIRALREKCADQQWE